MKRKNLYIAVCLLVAFTLWTVLVQFVNVQPIGPNGSKVGFATVNTFVGELIGVHMTLYIITDWLGLVPLILALGFAGLGLAQWMKRKDIRKVDYSILVLGGFYIVVMAVYFLFEVVVINYRPVLIEGFLEASYPSSTTMLVLCVMPTAAMQFNSRIKHMTLRNIIAASIMAFTVFMVIGRLLSGVHWFSDIIGGILLSTGLIQLYKSVCRI